MAGKLIPTSLVTILPLIRQQIQDSLGWGPERVLPVKKDERPFHGQAESYVTLRLKNQMAEAMVTGGGRWSPVVTRRLRCRLWSRVNLDETGVDTSWLLDSDRGHLTLEDELFEALLCFHPGTGGDLYCEPLKLGPCSEPTEEKDDSAWGYSEIEFDVTYELAITKTN